MSVNIYIGEVMVNKIIILRFATTIKGFNTITTFGYLAGGIFFVEVREWLKRLGCNPSASASWVQILPSTQWRDYLKTIPERAFPTYRVRYIGFA